MKKIIALLLLVTICLTFAGCKNKKDNLSDEYSDVIISTETVKDKDKDTSSKGNDTTDKDKSQIEKPDISTNSSTDTKNPASKVPSTTSTVVDSNHKHKYEAPTCSEPAKCSCGATSGSKADHSWMAATCTVPKTCSVCGAKKGNVAAHKYVDGKCTLCGAAKPIDINDLMAGTKYIGNLKVNDSKITAQGIYFSDRSAGGLQDGFRCFLYDYELSETEIANAEKFVINNKTYYVKSTNGHDYDIGIEGSEIIIKNKKGEDYSGTPTLKLCFVGENIKVIASTLSSFPVNTVFNAN